MNFAVSGLSPVTITVFTPIFRRRSKRSLMPGLMMSCNSMQPMMRSFSATTKGVPPLLAMRFTSASTSLGTLLPARSANLFIASCAPFRMR